MRNRRRRIRGGNQVTLGSQLLGLSLFVMLLAFFIVLNAISQFEQTKVHPVMESLSYAFASKIQQAQQDDRPSEAESEDKSINEGDTLERMKNMFTAQIPGARTVLSDRRGEMYVKMTFDELEAAVLAVGQSNQGAGAGKGFFLPTLVALMKTESAGMPYRMDMTLNISENPAALENAQPQLMASYIKRMSRIAQKLQDAGLPVRLVSTGMEKGEDGTVILLFRRHIPFNPLGDNGNAE